MKLKSVPRMIFAALLISAAPTATSASEPSLVLLGAGRHLIDIVLPPAERAAVFARVTDAMMANMVRGIIEGQAGGRAIADDSDLKNALNRFVERLRELAQRDLKMSTPALIEAYARAYARRFTIADMEEIGTFFASAPGRKCRIESSSILSDPDVAGWQVQAIARAQARLPDELAKFKEEIASILATKGRRPHGA